MDPQKEGHKYYTRQSPARHKNRSREKCGEPRPQIIPHTRPSGMNVLPRNTTHNAPITDCIKEKQSFSSPKKKIELKTRATNSQILKNLIHPTSTTLTHKKHPILKITTPTSTYGLPKVPRPHLHTVSQTSHAYIYIRSPKSPTPTSTYGHPKVPRPHLHTVSQTSHAHIYIRSPKSPTPISTYGLPKIPRPHLHTVSQKSHAHI